jgi:hypothetical protein
MKNLYQYQELGMPFIQLLQNIIQEKAFLENEMEKTKNQLERYVFADRNDERIPFVKQRLYKFHSFLELLFNLTCVMQMPDVSFYIQGLQNLINKEGGIHKWPVYKSITFEITKEGPNVYLIKKV